MTAAEKVELARIRAQIDEAEQRLTALKQWAAVLEGKADMEAVRKRVMKAELS